MSVMPRHLIVILAVLGKFHDFKYGYSFYWCLICYTLYVECSRISGFKNKVAAVNQAACLY